MPGYKSIELYKKLIEKVEQFESKLLERYSSDISCRMGCDACCILESVFPVEAYVIFQAFNSADKTPCDSAGRVEGRCVFLKNGICSIYGARPVICRTHGYPVLVEGRVDFCPENFRERSSIDSEYILNLENLNSALASINLIFLKEIDEHFFKRERISLKELADFILL